MQSKFWPILIVTVTSLLLVRLGFWQLDRAEQKQQALAQAGHQQVLNLAAWQQQSDKSKVNNRSVELVGQITGSEVWLLDNQIYQGQVGYSVITYFNLVGSTEQVLVNWGWVKAPKRREALPEIRLTKQPLRLTGLVKTKGFGQMVLKQTRETGWPRRIQSMQTLDLATGVIYADTGVISGYIQTYQPVVMPPEKHYAYAMQWFLLALANVCVFIVALKQRGKKQ